MEFLLVSARSDTTNVAGILKSSLVGTALVKQASSICKSYNDGHLTIAISVDAREYLPSKGIFYDGCAVYGGVLHTASNPPLVNDDFTASARGMFGAIWSDMDGNITIRRDQFGVYPIWSGQIGQYFAVSNNVHAIAQLRKALGFPVERNAIHIASELAFENGLWGSSCYSNIQILPADEHIEISYGGIEKFLRTTPWFYNSPQKYEELLDQAVEELKENVIAIANAPFSHRISDLTGGYDSRLIAAAIMATGTKDEFGFFTSGVNTGDSVSASHIRQQFNLRRALFRQAGSAGDMIKNTQRSLWATYGTQTMADLRKRSGNNIELNGLLGEFFRQFYLRNENEPPIDAIKRQFESRTNLLKPSTVDHILGGFDEFFKRKKQEGYSEDHALCHLYLEQRNSNYNGVLLRSKSNVMPVSLPLYSPAGLAAALAHDDEYRKSLKVVYDIMKRLEPEMIFIPLEKRRWPSPDIEDIPRLSSVMPCVNGDKDKEDASEQEIIEMRSLFEDSLEVASAWAKTARKNGLSWNRVYLDRALSFGNSCLQDDNIVSSFEGFLDVDRLRAVFNRRPEHLKHNTEIRQVWRLLYAISWLSESEVRVSH